MVIHYNMSTGVESLNVLSIFKTCKMTIINLLFTKDIFNKNAILACHGFHRTLVAASPTSFCFHVIEYILCNNLYIKCYHLK